MGVFDAICSASGIVLDGATRLVFVLEDSYGRTPCLPPLVGNYDRYGKIENIITGPARSAAEKLAERFELDDLDELLGEAFEPGIQVAHATLRYALVDELIYRAAVGTVASGGVDGVEPDLEATLTKLPFAELVRAAVGAPDFAMPLLEAFQKDESLRHELVALALFRKMPIQLRATTPDSPSGQYLFFHESVAKKQGLEDEAVETETRKAEEAFASYPLVLAAIAENERVWIDRQAENLDDGDDDDDESDDDADDDDDDGDDGDAQYTVSLKPPKGQTLPPLLTDFAAWLKKRSYGAVGYFELLVEALPKEDPRLAKRLRDGFSFVHLPEGSLLLLVKNEDHPHAVALLGSEGETRTIATSLEEFLGALAEGDTGIMELDDEDATERKALADFLKSKKVTSPAAPDFDFQAWLDGIPQSEARPRTPPPAVKPALVPDLPEPFARLAGLIGRRADDPEVVTYVREVLGKRAPISVADDTHSNFVINKSLGIELLFDHDVKNDACPLVPRTESGFVPYLSYAWLRKPFPGGLPFGLELGDGKRGAKWGGVKPIDSARPIVLDLDIFKPGQCAVLRVEEAREIVSRHGLVGQRVALGVFLAWALERDVLDKTRFAEDAALLEAIAKREKQGSALLAALARGLWDTHLRDLDGLREFARENFRHVESDLIKQFGKRKNKDGDFEPKLDDDTWDAVDKMSSALDKRFARWVKKSPG